mgnify:CR=1 FL=1
MSSVRILTALTILAAAVLAAGCGGHEAERAEANLPPVKSRLETVSTRTDSRAIELYGTVQPARQSFVSSRVMGPVVAIHVQPGDVVKKGRPLLEIEPASTEGQLSQAQGALAQAQAALSLAEKNYRRYETLHQGKAASDLELDMARMQYEQAQGAVDQAEGAVKSARSLAGEASVAAPFNARVVEKLAEVGDLAAPGRPLIRLESLSGRQVWLTVREADIHRVTAGQTIGVRFDARPELGLVQGTVDEVAPAADPGTHTFTVKVGLEGVDVSSGSSGRGYLPGEITERIVIPETAVHRRGGLELAVILGEDGTSRTRAVTTGRTFDDGGVEVLSGLAEGDRVLVDAPGPMPDGTPVEVQ